MPKKSKALRQAQYDVALKDDPRVRDPVVFNRLKLMVEHEACHPAWGCVLYQLHRLGQITNEQKEAGDIYQKIFYDYERVQEVDPDVIPPDQRDLWDRRIERAKQKWSKAIDILGLSRKSVDSVVIENNHPIGERERLIVRDGLQLIANFFGRGRNKT